MNVRVLSILGIWLTLLAVGSPLQAAEVSVEVENLAPTGGVFLSPMWVGFDDGQFKLSTGTDGIGLELLAQNGDVAVLQKEFRTAAPKGVDGVIDASTVWPTSPFFGPGTAGKRDFTLDPTTDRFMNFASKVYPSTAAFIASQSPIEIFDAQGKFKGKQIITILGSEVQEVATLTSGTTATANQSQSATGASTTGTTATRSSLADRLANLVSNEVTLKSNNESTVAHFEAVASNLELPNTAVARITIVPEPATVILLAGGSLMLLRRRQQTHRQ
jgi:hypothetical protein